MPIHMVPSMHNSIDLVGQFARAAESASASVELIRRSPDLLDQALRRVTRGTSRIILAEPDDLSPELFLTFKKTMGVSESPTSDDMASAQVGITDAFGGVARTGSVCISITRNYGGAISVFAPFHICVLEAQTIVARPRDVFTSEALVGKGLYRNFVFVTGPSATADMGPLVRGVHGPAALHIIILE